MTVALPADTLAGIGTPACATWRAGILARHTPIAGVLARQYKATAKAAGYVAANQQLAAELPGLKLAGTGLAIHAGDDEIRQYARVKSRNIERDFTAIARRLNIGAALAWLRGQLAAAGLALPLKDKDSENKAAQLSAVARCCCERWWRRQLRTLARRKLEHWQRARGQVCRQRGAYVSGLGLARRGDQRRRNAQLLAGLEAVADTGEVVNLADAVAASVSNPANRRHELMTRMAGYEEVAGALGLVGEFLTLTCPSAYHPVLHSTGARNPKYNGTDPRAAQDYLCMTWANIRAAWHRAGIRAYGFRVAEPHHDGTPHWHLLLFFRPDQADAAWQIFEAHALAVDGDESGAQDKRAARVTIDPAKGTAAGYLAKYVAKNIDGFGLDESGDHEAGTDALEGARRVDAWASIWGIRQFQQIGSHSVTVWRELRRLREALPAFQPETLEAIRAACDRGDWAEFVRLMGGALVTRDGQTLRAWMVQRETENQYAEITARIRGVLMRGIGLALSLGIGQVVTRDKSWAIRRAESAPPGAATGPPRRGGLDLCQ